ncbi:MAG: hypothetical protein KF850_02380 [Labilithrix sp.]|nr:hypothetical protein [Labilithrix sp.]
MSVTVRRGTPRLSHLPRVVPVLALLAFGLGACSTSTEPVGAPASDRREADDPVQQTSTAISALCNGQPGVTFIARTAGGQPSLSQQIVGQNGYSSLVVTGECRAYCTKDGKTFTSELDETRRRAFVTNFRLTELADHVGKEAVGSGCFDGSPTSISFGGHAVTGRDCGEEPAESAWTKAVFDHYRAVVEDCAAGRTAWEGDGRYLLVASDDARDVVFADAPSWPLADAASSVATTSAEANTSALPSLTRLVSGADAEKLRALRASFDASGIRARLGIDFIPVVDAEGKRYELMFRDALPIEGSDGSF